MKNLAITIFLVLSFLITGTACAQNTDTDIEEAKYVVNEYYRLSQQGDIEAINKLATDASRKKNEAEFERIGVVTEYVFVLMKNSTYEIKSVERKGNEIHAVIYVTSPDSNLIAEKVMENFDTNLSMEDKQRVFNDNAIKILQTENIPKVVDKKVMVLIKEKGQWKITTPGMLIFG